MPVLLETKAVTKSFGGLLANSEIEKVIGRKMSYPVGSDIRETYDMMVQSLKRYEIGEGFFLTGTLGNMEVQQPILVPAGIVAPVSIKGKLAVKLE